MKRQKKLNKFTQADMILKNRPTKVNPKVAKILQAAATASMMASAATGETPYIEVDPDSELSKAIEEKVFSDIVDSSNGVDA